MRNLYAILLLLLTLGANPVASGSTDKSPSPEEIIRRFAEKEAEFRREWQNYTYAQSLIFEVLNDFGNVVESKTMRVEVFFDSDGKRSTRVVERRGQLRSVQVTDQDLEDAVEMQPFVLTTEELPKYDIKYRGEEWVDEINTYVFDVKPKTVRRSERYFEGRIWVDDLDLQIVKTRGKIVPDLGNNKFPAFEAVRQQIDGKFWFPVWIKADDHLTFGGFWNRHTVHVRQWTTFENFQRFEVETKIRFEEVQPDQEPPQ